MKAIYFIAGLLWVLQAHAQQQTGRVVYEFTHQLMLRADGAGKGNVPPPPPSLSPSQHVQVTKLEVMFGSNQMLRRQLEDNTVTDFPANDNGMQIRFGMGDDDITWLNFTEGRKVEQKEFAAKQYLVTDSIRKLNWKLTGESKTMLGYTCQQAVTTRPGKRNVISMENGVMSRKEIPDTSQIVAWFTPAIPVSAGPDFEGQLPGLILQVDINGNTTFKAVEVSQKVDEAAIKEPKRGKKVTAEEFAKERNKVMDDMQRNGGRRMMRVSN
jgi:GLPGLI family protein